MCSLNRILKLLLVCPMYAFLQSGHVSLYAPDLVYLSIVWYLCVSVLWIVFTLTYTTGMSHLKVLLDLKLPGI